VAERLVNGDKIGNPTKALATFFSEFVKLETSGRSEVLQRAQDWGKENNLFTMFQADHVNPLTDADVLSKTKRNLLERLPANVEERGNRISFLAHYSYLRTLMPEEQALHAAALKMKTAMGDYNRGNSASMFTDYGILGQSIRPFGLLRSVYWGKTMQSLVTVGEAFKKAAEDPRKAPLVPAAASAFIAMQASYLAFAGVTGLIGSAEYDAAIKFLNMWFKPDVPLLTTGEWLRKNNAPDWSLFGLLGQMTGINIASSINAQSLTELGAFPGATAAHEFGVLATQTINGVTDKGVNWENVWGATRNLLPPTLGAKLEGMYAEKQGGVVPHGSNFTALISRTPREQMIAQWTGAHTTSEDKQRQDLTLYKYENGLDHDWKAQQISKIVTSLQGLDPLNPQPDKLIQRAFEAERGFGNNGGKDMMDAIKKEMYRRGIEEQLRNLMTLKAEGLAQKYNDFTQMQNLRMKGIQ
jgi:hypothetical protein